MGGHRLYGGAVSLMLGGLVACGSRQPMQVMPVSPTVAAALDPSADAQAHAAIPAGHRAAAALAGVAYASDQFSDWSVTLQAGSCYAFGYAADAGVARLSLFLWDPSGRRVATARNRVTAGAVPYCAVVSGSYRLQAKVVSGAGHYVVVPYQDGAGPAVGAPVAGGGVVAVAAPQRGAALDIATAIDRQAALAAAGATRLGDFFNGVGDSSDWSAQLTAGTCYWFVGAGEAGKVQGLTLSIWDPRQSPITQSRSDGQVATLAYCAKETGAYRFEAKVNGGKGDYKVAVYSK